MEAVIAIVIVSSIGAGLAALLVFSDRVISNYGECEINVNDKKKITVKGGGSLLETLTEQKLFIPSACGGRGTCGLCKIKVVEGAGIILPTEEPYLSPQEREQGIRLSCQVKVRNNIHIEIPEELFAIQEYKTTCVGIKDLTYDIKEFRFKLTEPPQISYTPGQYMQLLTPAYAKSPDEVYRAYSISGNPAEKDHIELIIRLVPKGVCTTYCFEYLKQNDPVRMNGPYGEFHLRDTDRPCIFIAGGSGMAPIKCILHHMENNKINRKSIYFFGGNQVRDLFLIDRMKQFEQTLPNFKFVPVVAKPAEGEKWDGELGLVTQVVERHIKDAADSEAYLCGSPGMIDASIVVLKKLGMPEQNIFFDKFS